MQLTSPNSLFRLMPPRTVYLCVLGQKSFYRLAFSIFCRSTRSFVPVRLFVHSLIIIFFQYLERRYSVGMRMVGCFFFVLTVVSIHFKNFWLCSFYFTFSTRSGFQPAEITRPSRSIDLNRCSMGASRRTKTLGNNRIITAGFSPFRFIKSNKP